MIGVLAYIAASVITSSVLSFIWIVSRPVHVRDEMRSWRVWFGMFAFVVFGPYIGFEVMTKRFGPPMKKAVENAIIDAEIEGDLQYYKVTWFSGEKAKVVAVAEEKSSWGGITKPVLKVNLVKENGKWKADSYELVVSEKENKDGMVFPPFW